MTPRRRSGATLPVMALVVLLAAAAALLMRELSQRRYREAHRHTFGLIALNLAESGLNLGFAQVRAQLEDPESFFHAMLIGAWAAELEGEVVPIDHPQTAGLVGVLGPGAELTLSVRFEGFAPLVADPELRGLVTDPREKQGRVVFEARGAYRGVVRTLSATSACKVVRMVAPVVSKFTLFVASRGEAEPNLLAYDRSAPQLPMEAGGRPARPLVLYHRPGPVPALAEDRFHPLGPVLESVEPDAGGLVYLGGERPWYLNLVHGVGAGPFDELHHLRRTRYRLDGGPPGAPGEHALWFGFYAGLLTSPPFRPFGAGSDPPRRPEGDTVPERTSALHLYGDVEDVSPTVVLGPVFRSYVTSRLEGGVWYPHLSAAEFGRLATRPAWARTHADYQARMVRVEHEPYNRSWDYMRTNQEMVDGRGQVGVAAGAPALPPALLTPETLTRVRPPVATDRLFLYPEAAQGPRTPVALGPAGGAPQFSGDLAGLDGELFAKVMGARAVHRVADAAAFMSRYVRQGRLRLPGVVRIERGDLEIGPLAIARGGVVVVEKGVRIAGWLRKLAARETLTLVALGGDVEVATPDRVEAQLVALAGRFRAQADQLDFLGGLAARELDLASLVAGARPKRVVYDPALDPTAPGADAAQLRAYFSEKAGLGLAGH